MTFHTITVTGKFQDVAQNYLGGSVSFVPNFSEAIDATAEEIFAAIPQNYAIHASAAGFTTAALVTTDSTDLVPSGWQYNATVQITGMPAWSFALYLPSSLGSTIDLSQLSPQVPSPVSGVQYLPVSVAGVVVPGADPTGTNDSTAAINAALAAAPAGAMTLLSPGTYKTSAPLTPPPGGGLVCAGDGRANTGAVIKPSASFSGNSVIYLADVGSAITQGPVLRGIAIDGSDLTVTADGIRAFGPVVQTFISGLGIYNCTGIGINQLADSGASGNQCPYGWWVADTEINGCAQGGAVLPGHTDSQWRNVYLIFNGNSSGHGIAITGSPSNSRFTDVRVEWTGTGDGWHLTGAWNTGTGSGPFTMTACSTDRNTQNGLYCDATGYAPVLLSGCMFRRDGRNAGSGGGGYAGIRASSATIPLLFSNVCVFPGVDDTGSGTLSPEYGVSVASSTRVEIQSGYIQGATAATNGTLGNAFMVFPNVSLASGSTGGPSVSLTDIYVPSAGIIQSDNDLQINAGFVEAERFNAGGITGAAAQSRYVGAIASGTAPVSGTFDTGDFIIIQTGGIAICTAGGSPGTWTAIT